MDKILHDPIRTLNYGNYGIVLIMGNAGVLPFFHSLLTKGRMTDFPSYTFRLYAWRSATGVRRMGPSITQKPKTLTPSIKEPSKEPLKEPKAHRRRIRERGLRSPLGALGV